MHYGFEQIKEMATEPDENGYQTAIVTLENGDTAYAPGTTKYDLAGVGSISYLIHPSSVEGRIAKDAKIYRQLKPNAQ